MSHRYFYCIFLFSLLSISSYAKEKIIRVATLANYAPFCSTVGKFEANQIIKKESVNQANFLIYYTIEWRGLESFNGKVVGNVSKNKN